MKQWLLLSCFSFIWIAIYAQNNSQIRKSNSGRGLIYNTEKALLLEAKTNGFNVGYQWGTLKTYYKTTFYRLDMGYIRHPKETRVSPNGASVPTNSYFYGKENSFWQIRGGWGTKRYFSEKDAARGVAVGMSYNFGPTLGLLKPYYLNLNQKENSTIRLPDNYIKYSSETAKKFLDKTQINGAAPLTTGLGETRFTPGAHANIGIHMDWGAYEDYVRSLEAGIAVDAFFKKVPILVSNEQNRLYFVNLYVHLQIGKRK
jgi:hypothetical protein